LSIDWKEAKEKPDKTQKVLNSYLLDINAKIDDLERRAFELRQSLDNKNDDVIKTKMKLANATNFLKELLHNYTAIKKDFKILQKQKEDKEARVFELEDLKKDMEKKVQKIPELERAIDEKDKIMKEKEEKLEALHDTFDSKIRQIEELKTDLLEKEDLMKDLNSMLEKKDEKLDTLDDTFDSKMNQIKELKTELLSKDEIMKDKTHKVKQLKFKLNTLEKREPESRDPQSLIERIEEILKLKGFLSEKELEMLKSGKSI